MSWSTPDKTKYPLIDTLQNTVQHVRIDVYERNNYTTKLGSIEGLVTGGNINVNGSSSVRRTGSLSLVVDDDYIAANFSGNINTISNLLDASKNAIATNKEVKIFIGVEDIDGAVGVVGAIYEFKLGCFVMKTASITHNTSGLNISLTLSDLMSKLNGELGGTLPNAMTHHPELYKTGEVDEHNVEEVASRPVLVKNIILTLVQEFGGIPNERIILDPALDKPIQNTVRWIGSRPVSINGPVITTVAPAQGSGHATYFFNDNIGYQLTDFTFPGKALESNAGESIVSVLEKVKNAIGDYEYYFDVDGNFHFEQVKTYLNEGSEVSDIEGAIADKYLMEPNSQGVAYDFTGSPLITSYQSNPQWLNLKNDITVWGQRGDKTPLWYHLIIGEKYKSSYRQWNVSFDKDGAVKKDDAAVFPRRVATPVGQKVGSIFIESTPQNAYFDVNNKCFKKGYTYTFTVSVPALFGDAVNEKTFTIQGNNQNTLTATSGLQKVYFQINSSGYLLCKIGNATSTTPYAFEAIANIDWRSQLVFDYVTNKIGATSYWLPYAKELLAQWPRVFDIEKNQYRIDTGLTTWLNNLTYFFDALDPDDVEEASSDAATALRNIAVETIGAREKVITNAQLNIMFPMLYENNIYVVAGYGNDTKAERVKALEYIAEQEEGKKSTMIQVSKNLGECISIGSAVFSMYDCVRANLHQLTSYAETISVGIIPIFHLEPNTRVTFEDADTGIQGDYIINSFSIPLAASGTMTLSCSKAIERI